MKPQLRYKPLTFLAATFLISACVGIGKNSSRSPSSQSFGDHIQAQFSNLDGVHQYAGVNAGEFQMKFILLDFQASTGSDLFLDPRYFQFHDEWFLMRTFSGQDFPWMNLPAYGQLQAANPKELQTALKKLPSLPQGLVRVNDRVIADNFYKASSGPDRSFALGSVNYSYIPKRALPQVYYFDMVFNDVPTEAEVEKMRSRLSKTLHIADLKWLPRSQTQESLAQTLKAKNVWQKRIISYDDLIVPGQIKVYSEQTVAGIPVYFPKGTYDPSRLSSENIVMLDELPDDLPPVRGIITSVPQTELAHINILARARGSLNVFLADPKMFADLKAREASKQPVGLWAHADGLKITDLNPDEYAKYQKFFEKDAISLQSIDVSKLDYLYDLKKLNSWTPDQVVRTVGGKSMGMIRLLQVPGILVPPQPFGLSVRAYREHLNTVLGTDLQATLADARFVKDAKIRYLVLEGPKKFKSLYPKEVEQPPFKSLIAGTDATPLGKIVARKGIKEMIEDQKLDSKLEALLTAELKTRFPKLPQGQAFRFRSSADVEDIPGFVGAGLYDSYSGFIDPSAQALNDDDKKKTIARAVKKTWASYWNYRAFEERELSRIDHLSGSMGVMIHPNFPESAEKANGVLTVRWRHDKFGKSYDININTNIGETAVVRPDGSISVPQTMDIRYSPGSPLYFRQIKEASDGTQVLSKEQATELSEMAVQIFDSWISHLNKDLKPELQHTHYMLDMEFKLVPANWAVDFSSSGSEKFILKQARPLMKSQKLSPELVALPIPRSLLSEATKIIRRTIDTDLVRFSTIEVYDAETEYDQALNVQTDFAWKQAVGKRAAGTTTQLLHTDFSSYGHGFMHHGPWDFSFSTKPEAEVRTGVISFQAYESGSLEIETTDAGTLKPKPTNKIQIEPLLEAPSVWLGRLICNKVSKSISKPPGIGFPPLKPAINIGIGIGLPIGGGGDELNCHKL